MTDKEYLKDKLSNRSSSRAVKVSLKVKFMRVKEMTKFQGTWGIHATDIVWLLEEKLYRRMEAKYVL